MESKARVHWKDLPWNKQLWIGPGYDELNDCIFNNKELFKDVVNFDVPQNTIDNDYKAIKIAVTNFVTTQRVKDFIEICLQGKSDDEDFEKIFYQYVSRDIKNEILNFIKNDKREFNELSSYFHSHIMDWSFTSNISHVLIGLGEERLVFHTYPI